MAIGNFRWILIATTALVALGGPASAQAAPAGGAASTTGCQATSKDPDCRADAKASGSTYLTPLVVSGAADSGGVGDPYAMPKAVTVVGTDEINQFGGQNLDNVLRTTARHFHP